ncbi:MAG: hypothetical protein HYS98_08225 [Deltaproteobacteria bacterium]|nr:hypothetical protein [Deltaproteobacteria bacterium]
MYFKKVALCGVVFFSFSYLTALPLLVQDETSQSNNMFGSDSVKVIKHCEVWKDKIVLTTNVRGLKIQLTKQVLLQQTDILDAWLKQVEASSFQREPVGGTARDIVGNIPDAPHSQPVQVYKTVGGVSYIRGSSHAWEIMRILDEACK